MSKTFVAILNKEERKKIRNGPVRSIIRFARTIKYPEDMILDVIVNASAEIAAEAIEKERDLMFDALVATHGIGPKRVQEVFDNVKILRSEREEVSVDEKATI